MIYGGPDFLAVVWFGSSLPPSPVSKSSLFLSLPVCVGRAYWLEKGGEVLGEEPNCMTARKPGPPGIIQYSLGIKFFSPYSTVYMYCLQYIPQYEDLGNRWCFFCEFASPRCNSPTVWSEKKITVWSTAFRKSTMSIFTVQYAELGFDHFPWFR